MEENINYFINRINIILSKNLTNFSVNKKKINNKYQIDLSYHYINKKYTCELMIHKELSKEQIEECINKLILQIESKF